MLTALAGEMRRETIKEELFGDDKTAVKDCPDSRAGSNSEGGRNASGSNVEPAMLSPVRSRVVCVAIAGGVRVFTRRSCGRLDG